MLPCSEEPDVQGCQGTGEGQEEGWLRAGAAQVIAVPGGFGLPPLAASSVLVLVLGTQTPLSFLSISVWGEGQRGKEVTSFVYF